jgi:hypothetical protein
VAIKRTKIRTPPTHPKVKRGRTHHETTGYQFPLSADEDVELAREIEESAVDVFLSRAEEWARDVLTAAELPTHLDAVRRDADGKWLDDLPESWRQQELANFLKPGEAVTSLLGLVEDRPHSIEWRAERILRFAIAARHRMRLGDVPGAVWNAVQLTQALHLAEFKLDLERPLDLGKRSIEVGEHGKKRSREIEHMEWKAVFDKIRRESPELLKAEVHRMVAGRFEVNEPAVKKAIWRLKKNGQA